MTIIRAVQKSDLTDIQRVSRYLHDSAYTIDDFEHSIQGMEDSPNDFVYVAECEARVIGWIHFFYARRLATPDFVEMGGLVVDPEFRGRGIGKLLVNRIWETGAGKFRVRCNEKRKETHEFYKSLGFSTNKSQLVFERNG